jgi:hypothetical protein
MKKTHHKKNGSTVICAVLTLLIVSLIGATVLFNCTTRYNASSKQVKGWNEALYAAEAGADVAFAEVRKIVSNGSTFSGTFVSSDGWTVAAAPTPGPAYSNFYLTSTRPIYLGQNNSLKANVTVDKVTSTNGFDCYRIRSVGIATLFGLSRTGMDDKLLGAADTTSHFSASGTTRGSGDSLLRKIDFTYDHFLATYGDGDGNGKQIQTVSNPQVTRRIETVAVPQWAFTGALKATGSFNGPGSAGQIDSYDSINGAYPGASVASDPSNPLYKYATSGDVSVGSASFTDGGPIYGNLTTNGGNATHSNATVSGTIDNNVPFSLTPLLKPDTTSYTTGSSGTLNVPTGTSASNPAEYVYSSLSGGLTINSQNVASGLPNAGSPAETYVTIVVNGDVGGKITINKGVNAKIYFTGTLSMKAQDIVNNNVDAATGVYNADGSASTDYSRAGHMQFYGISPTDGSEQTISIASPGDLWATFYAPSANFSMAGNPQVYGAIAVEDFAGNGNTGFHYDKEVIGGIPIDYQIASYIEDIR